MREDKCWSGGWGGRDAERRRALSDMWAQLNRHNAGVVLYPVKIEQFSSCLPGVKQCTVGADGRDRNKRTVMHRTTARRLGATCCLYIMSGQPNSTASYHRTLTPRSSTLLEEANNSSAGQEISDVLRNPNVHYRDQNSAPLVLILS